jgi:bifunctional N-acetylglucosamine-1-phosphate-uridyltransferase/glucosamine-1-phosphate-acetyltransferase GlmU-like protein
MATADLYIVAAGNGSRMNASLPKALVPITSEPCLTTTLQQIGRKFGRVFVITNVLARDAWVNYLRHLESNYPQLSSRVIQLPIRSGLGDGHATLQGLLAAEATNEPTLAEEVVVAWGDVFFPHAEIIDELLAQPLPGAGLLPAVHETAPYVALLVDEQMRCISADFSKYGEVNATGFHDQSVFRFSRTALKESLRAIHNALWKGHRYITPSGELSLLYSFHQLYNSGNPLLVYETRYPTLSFNTVEEVRAIQAEINEQWDMRLRRGQRPSSTAIASSST